MHETEKPRAFRSFATVARMGGRKSTGDWTGSRASQSARADRKSPAATSLEVNPPEISTSTRIVFFVQTPEMRWSYRGRDCYLSIEHSITQEGISSRCPFFCDHLPMAPCSSNSRGLSTSDLDERLAQARSYEQVLRARQAEVEDHHADVRISSNILMRSAFWILNPLSRVR